MSGASFAKATLGRASFHASRQRPTILAQVCWREVKQLDRARLGGSILADQAVRELLVSGYGYKKDYTDANLQDADLSGANLNGANLTRANLSQARLHNADLREATLTAALAVGTDFAGAALTGACLEAWNIDHTTNLSQVDCQFVFLLERPNALGSRERRPHEPDAVFGPGDFEKLYRKVMNTVQLLLRNGVNPEAFAAAFQQLMQEHPDLSYDSIIGIEKKDGDVLLTLEVPDTADKAAVSRSFLHPYETKVRQLEAEVTRLQELRSADLKEIALTIARQKNTTIAQQVIGDGRAMTENTDKSQAFNVGGDFTVNATNSVVSLGELSGTVTNTIQQIPASAEGDQLRELLTQLQATLLGADDAALSPDDKTDALAEVKLLAEAAQQPDPEQKKTLAGKAMRSLKRIAGGIPTAVPATTALIESVNKLLPAIATLLGILV
ncbi:pentapeptide repeat-containing protein [Leptolyngbya sp. O-77]|uniref:pentapeptide repeat-containing protein n=1 Tax=Leptolyngbya sp. O-77 TaxID=1080068 RepID=UPI00256FAB69|nr:pentapeptide repeat-containing protein [Leptolyngbya sp. O-77]